MSVSFRAGLCVLASLSLSACMAGAEHPKADVDRPMGDGGVSAFYARPARVPSGAGRMIRVEDMTDRHLPEGTGRAVRVLYTSVSGVGAAGPIVVSGQVLFPQGEPPKGGWPVVAWEHGTTGIADICAPSWRGYLSRDRAYLAHWLKAGFAVVASDYQGLGTPGPHPYLMFRPEGYSVLDGLRAALGQYAGVLQNRIVLVGQSQGGGAALGTAWLAPDYAPDLHVLGTVATGVVTAFHGPDHPKHVPLPRNDVEPSHMAAAFEILTVEGSKASLHPESDVRATMTEKGKALSHQARQVCLGDLFRYTEAHDITNDNAYTSGAARFEAEYQEAFTIPDARIRGPVFVGTGLADNEAGVAQQYNAVAAMCDAGTDVTWREYPGLTHNGAVNGSAGDSVPFALSLLKGERPKGNCATIRPVSELQKPISGVRFNN